MSKESKNFLNQSKSDLLNAIFALKKELFNLRFQRKIGELKNTSRFSVVRKKIACIKTELTRRLKTGE